MSSWLHPLNNKAIYCDCDCDSVNDVQREFHVVGGTKDLQESEHFVFEFSKIVSHM